MNSPGPSLPQTTSQCFVCGPDHPCGLHLCFERAGAGRVRCSWEVRREWQGFEGVIHGGIVSTVLDEAMSKAVASSEIAAFTCELRVRLRQHVRPGEQLVLTGWIVEKKKRRILTEASLMDSVGREKAHAWAVFLEVH